MADATAPPSAMSVLVARNRALIGWTLLNYVTYSTWTIMNKLQFSRSVGGDSGGAVPASPQPHLHDVHAHHVGPGDADDGFEPSWHNGFGVTVPLFVTGLQMFIAGALAGVAIYGFRIQARGSDDPPLLTGATLRHRIIPLGFARCVDIGFGNAALVSVSVALQQVIKSLLPLFVSVLSVVVLNKSVSRDTWLTMLPIVGGTVLATVGGRVQPSPTGVAMATVSCFGRAFKAVLNAKLLKPTSAGKDGDTDERGPDRSREAESGVPQAAATGNNNTIPLRPLEILLLEAPTTGLMLLALSVVVEWDNLHRNWSCVAAAMPLNVVGGFLMFVNQTSYITVIERSSAITCQVLMNIKMLLLILISVHVFNTPLQWWNGVGMLLATSGCMGYAAVASRPQRVVVATKSAAEVV